MKRRDLVLSALSAPVAWMSAPRAAYAADRLRIAIGEGSTFDTAIPVLADRAGIFTKHGLSLDFTYTQGSGETIQTVLSRSVDVGVAAGTTGVLGAFAKGAPLRIISAQSTGARDFFWFVPANSPIKSMTDISGKTVAYSVIGSSTYAVAIKFAEQFKVTPQLVATGAAPATYTAAMSGQVDVGWGAAPFALEPIREGKIRVLVSANDVGNFKNETVRVNISHAAVIQSRRQVLTRFLAAYEEAIDWMYSSPDAVAWFAERTKVPLDIAIQNRDIYVPKKAVQLRQLYGLDSIVADALTFKQLSSPLTPEQVSTVIQTNLF